MNLDMIDKSKKYSNEILKKIKDELNNQITNDDICIVTTGSYARDETSEESDMDYYVIVKNGKYDLKFEEKEIITTIINKYVAKDSGDTGTFGDNAIERSEDMLKNIGGSEDSNIKITRRMLFLLESKALYNDSIYDMVMDKLISIYVKNIKKEQIARFLLNDIIRYYRTITVDFEFKTSEASKSWGLRNIKLTYSRKLIYFAGILCVAKTQDLEKNEKVALLKDLFKKTPLERIDEIISNEDIEKSIFQYYNDFLEQISKKDIRKKLNLILTIDDARNETFNNLKNDSKKFSQKMIESLINTFDKNHRIHEAILV